ncbi:MAG: sulfatase, partial [Gemmatimonadota bacterium]
TGLADRCFGELLEILERRGLRDDTLVVFLSDHGEEFDEHGDLGHGNNLYDESLRVPLIVDLPGARRREPGEAAQRRGGPASPVDVPATILAALDLPGLPEMEGRDLFASGRDAPRPVFAHLDYEGRRGVAVVLGPWKLIVPSTGALGRSPELYHLGRDPAERHDLAAERPVRAGYLETLVRRHLLGAGGSAPAEALEASPELREGLEALGYL